MRRLAPRRSAPSGSVLLWDRRHREATRALAAQVPGAMRAEGVIERPSPAAGGGGEPARAAWRSLGGQA
ncbi:hypothetical protein FOHLNKBM_4737 [Methylobacterium longum]|nr:hypothetical protein FOHLNKBM_4737 [Methylobacterium longum]